MSSTEQQAIEDKRFVPYVDDMFKEFETRLALGDQIFEKKFKRMYESRMVAKMELMFDANEQSTDITHRYGNDPNETKQNYRSHYQTTLLKAIGDAIIRDLTAKNMRFEWGANNKVGVAVKRAFDNILLKSYSYAGTERARIAALYSAVYNGCSIVQTFSENSSHYMIDPRTQQKVPVNQGRVVSMYSYDPMRVILDWNADPTDVEATSEFAIVLIGKFTKQQIMRKFPQTNFDTLPEKNNIQSYSASGVGISSSSNRVENRFNQLQESAGTKSYPGYWLYEYYTRDGYRYTIIKGYGIIDVSPNTNGIVDRIPLIVTPLFFDTDSPYGMSLYEMLQESIDVVNTAVNQIADINAITIKSPTFAVKGVLPDSFSLSDSSYTDVVPLDLSEFSINGNLTSIDINRFIGRIEFREVTDGSMFLLKTAMDNIWYVTGMNPTSLGGIQDKQIRVSGVADMMSQSSIRSSSVIVKNIETYLMNPLTRQFAQMFALYFEDFPEFQEIGLTKEIVMDIQNTIRVVNGSYLPADQYNEMQRTDALLQVASQTTTMDIVNVLIDWMQAHGEPYPERYFRDPLSTLTEQQLLAVVSLMNDKGAENVRRMFEQIVKQKEANGGAQR